MSYKKLFVWAIILLISAIVFNFLLANPNTKKDFETKNLCSSLDSFFNMTPEEYNCRLSNCEQINEEPYVDVCDCEFTKTKIFRYCTTTIPTTFYIADADKLRSKVLTKNPQLVNSINTSYNPGINLVYSDSSIEPLTNE